MGFQLIATVATMNLTLAYKPKDASSELGSWWASVVVTDHDSPILKSMDLLTK